MKLIIFLLAVVMVVGLVVWRLQKSHDEAESARLKSIKRRKQKEKEALTPEIDMIWPVIVRPLKGEHPGEKESTPEEPSMTEIEFESSGEFAAQRGKSEKAAG